VTPIVLDGVLTVEMAAERRSMHPTTITRAVRRGELAAERIAGRLFIRPDALDRWADSRIDHRRRQP
jgi:excisionase family DNA binding protein